MVKFINYGNGLLSWIFKVWVLIVVMLSWLGVVLLLIIVCVLLIFVSAVNYVNGDNVFGFIRCC